jgi:hypothetical protein
MNIGVYLHSPVAGLDTNLGERYDRTTRLLTSVVGNNVCQHYCMRF